MHGNNTKTTTADKIIIIALDVQVPPLYHAGEKDGIIIKTYPFIRGHSKIYDQQYPDIDIEQKDYSLLSVYKSELENQLELNRTYCIRQYNTFKLATRNWLSDKLWKIGRPINISEAEHENLTGFAFTVNFSIYWTMLGVDSDRIIEHLKDDIYKPVIEIQSVTFDISEIFKKNATQFDNIQRVVSRSVDLYFKYINVQSRIYKLDTDELLFQIKKDFESSNGKLGRPLDETAPQEDIQNKVVQLIELKEAKSKKTGKTKKFVNKAGKPKPTTIRDFIVSDFPELTGEVDERTVFNRVERAIKKHEKMK